MWTLLFLAATVRSFAHMPLGISDRNTRTDFFIYNSLQSCVRLFMQVITNSCKSFRHERFMLEKFFKNEISENISQKFHDQWKIE